MATARDIQSHYDVDTDFYASFLDRRHMAYSCAVWSGAADLETAQEQKLARIARFGNIKHGDRVLDIGCGWGGMMRFCLRVLGAASAVGLTLSRDQYHYVKQSQDPRCQVVLQSWESWVPESKFDAVVSIGAFEHFASVEDWKTRRQVEVYRRFFRKCAQSSTPGARLGLQTIVVQRRPRTSTEVKDVKFLLDSVFPGSALPYISDIQMAVSGIYEIHELRTIGEDYARTLEEWSSRLYANRESVIRRHGEALFAHYDRYFSAARRGFENGCTNLVQTSLVKTEPSWNHWNERP